VHRVHIDIILLYIVLTSSDHRRYTWRDREIILLWFVRRSREKSARTYTADDQSTDDRPDKCTSLQRTVADREWPTRDSLTRRPMFSCIGNTTMSIIIIIIRIGTYYRYYIYLHFARALFGYDDDVWCITSTKCIYYTLYNRHIIMKACIIIHYYNV